MAVRLIVEARDDPTGAYHIYNVQPVPGAIGGLPQSRPPFTAPAQFAADEVAAAGFGRAFAVDVGDGYAHVYVRVAGSGAGGGGSQPRQRTRQPTREPINRDVVPWDPGGDPQVGGRVDQLIRFARGLLGKAIKDWAKMSPNASPESVWNAAVTEESDLVAVAGLLQSVNNPSEGITGVILYWVGQQRDGSWFVPIKYLPDVDIPEGVGNLLIDTNRLYRAHTPDGQPPPPGGTGTSAPSELRYGALSEILGVPPTRPKTVTIRRCGRGMRLGIDGACYPKKLLTAATRANNPKKAKISHRDWQIFKKSKSVKNAILQAAEDVEHEEKEHSHRHRHR